MPVIKLRGLPWSCTPEDIEQFLGESINIVKTKSEDDEQQQSSDNDSSNNNTHHSLSICLTTNAEGRPSGEAFVELVDESDVETALRKNNGMMGQRYIEVFRSSIEQMKRFTAESNESASQWRDPVVRIRGLPYGCTKKDVHEFFNGLSIAYDGILLVVDFSGRFNGEAFVHFSNMSDAHKALEKHKQKMGNRYLEIFRSSLKEKRHYSGDGGGGEQDNYGGDFFGGETMMGGGMMGFGDDYSNNGFSNGGGGGGGRNGKMMNKRGMKGSGRFNGSNGNVGGGMGGGGGMDNRSRPYPNMRGGGNRQNGGGGGNFGGQSGNMMGPGGFGNGNSGVGGLPSLMGNSFNANGAGGFGGGVGPLMMGGPNNPSSFFNGGNDFNMRFGGNKNSQQQNIDSSYESGFGLKMRGLPFSCREDDIYEFFAPLKPVRVEFLRGRDSRPSGECEVDFESQDELDEAMTYDKKFIGNRYIELFLLNNNNGNNGNTNSLGGVGVGGGGGGGGGGKNMGNKNSANGGGGGSNGLMSQHHHHSNNNHNNGNMNFGGSGGNKSGGRGGGGQTNGNNGTSATANIPSLFAQPTIPAPIAAGLGGGGGSMTTAYPHQQMAAAVSAYSANSMGDMLMADMAKKMFQNAFAPYQNQMFHHNHQQIEPPQQFHQHFGSGGGGGGGNKGHNRRF